MRIWNCWLVRLCLISPFWRQSPLPLKIASDKGSCICFLALAPALAGFKGGRGLKWVAELHRYGVGGLVVRRRLLLSRVGVDLLVVGSSCYLYPVWIRSFLLHVGRKRKSSEGTTVAQHIISQYRNTFSNEYLRSDDFKTGIDKQWPVKSDCISLLFTACIDMHDV